MLELQFKKINTEDVQKCPLCGMPQTGFVKGTKMENGEVSFSDKWYSFCNCNNIYFTDWSNIKQEVYDSAYQKKYQDKEFQKKILLWAEKVFDKIPKKSGKFMEIGVAYDTILDEAQRRGFKTAGIDINPELRSGHYILKGDIENLSKDDWPWKCDVIWAAHIFEHVKDPILLLKNIRKNLAEDGVLYVAMPDPWFITWSNPHLWGHWHVQEHHIMWDMDSFIDKAIESGYELVSSSRRAETTDYQIFLRKGNQ